MKYSTKLCDAIHTLVFIYFNPKEDLSSKSIADSINTNPSYVRQLMSALNKAGILKSIQGHAKPELAKDSKKITLCQIYLAVEGNKPLLHLDTNTNPDCCVGSNIQITMKSFYDEIQSVAIEKMKAITFQDILDEYIKNDKK